MYKKAENNKKDILEEEFVDDLPIMEMKQETSRKYLSTREIDTCKTGSGLSGIIIAENQIEMSWR
jgi:hypothetical protein